MKPGAATVFATMLLCNGFHLKADEIQAATNRMEIATYAEVPTVRVYELLLEEVYARAGLELVFEVVTVPRAIRQVLNGSLDGLLMTSRPVNEGESLVRVPEPLPPINFKLMALKSFHHKTLEPTLKSYSIGYIGGIRLLQDRFGSANAIEADGGYEQLIKLLRHKRIDLMAIGEWDGLSYVLQNEDIKMYDEFVFPFIVYHVLHSRHGHFADVLAKTLREIKTENCLTQIVDYVVKAKSMVDVPGPPRLCPPST